MKHIIITLKYLVPIQEIDQYLVEHRSFLDSGYEKKILMASGPQNPREGGILIARAASVEEVKEFCRLDPFFRHNLAEYTFTEFIPVKYLKEFKDWFLPEV